MAINKTHRQQLLAQLEGPDTPFSVVDWFSALRSQRRESDTYLEFLRLSGLQFDPFFDCSW